jgi:hypothetical protein
MSAQRATVRRELTVERFGGDRANGKKKRPGNAVDEGDGRAKLPTTLPLIPSSGSYKSMHYRPVFGRAQDLSIRPPSYLAR